MINTLINDELQTKTGSPVSNKNLTLFKGLPTYLGFDFNTQY